MADGLGAFGLDSALEDRWQPGDLQRGHSCAGLFGEMLVRKNTKSVPTLGCFLFVCFFPMCFCYSIYSHVFYTFFFFFFDWLMLGRCLMS